MDALNSDQWLHLLNNVRAFSRQHIPSKERVIILLADGYWIFTKADYDACVNEWNEPPMKPYDYQNRN